MSRLTFEEKTERIENALQRFRKISWEKFNGKATFEDVENWTEMEIEKARVLGFEDLLKCRLHNELNKKIQIINGPKKGNKND